MVNLSEYILGISGVRMESGGGASSSHSKTPSRLESSEKDGSGSEDTIGGPVRLTNLAPISPTNEDEYSSVEL